MRTRVKSRKEVDYLFPKETTWSLEVDGVPGYFWFYSEGSSQESDYHIVHSLPRRETEGKRAEREVMISADISSKNNTLSFRVSGPKHLVNDRKNEIDTVKSIISVIALEAQP